LKVLISAYACEPDEGSEPAVGWNCARQIAAHHEAWVITRSSNRERIERALAEEPFPRAHFVYFDLPRWARFWKKGNRGLHVYYYLWQVGAYFVARKLHVQVHFDLVHHVTFVNYWMPTFLPLLSAPFMWGPVGGAESTPEALRSALSIRGRIHERLRDIVRSLSEINPIVRVTARKSVVALATTDQTARRLESLGCERVLVYSQVGLPDEEIELLSALPVRYSRPFRVFSIGNLLHCKGFELGLRAFGSFHRRFPASEYWIIGRGPEQKRLEEAARNAGVAESVVFWGSLPRPEVLKKLAECDVLVHPTLHDSGGWVCAEAMAAGRPVICLDLGGPALQVTEETGIKLPAVSAEQIVRDLSAALIRLGEDPALRVRLGQASRRRVYEHLSWDLKGKALARLYEKASVA